ncbi:hypothetical protein A3SI_05959 [Nitritalea halalkaliphila LW7]|uniref:DUF3299 domain-containing protein n=2 Tax=Nitritalea TaxID=1187887 RepID=I5C7A0_9BACT|nr:hypothetical protein A3SI_05959 [Nitritalea halalkaliphila LW7]
MVVDSETSNFSRSYFVSLSMKRFTPFLFFIGFSALLLGSLSATALKEDMWALFGKTRFIEKLNREYNMYFLYPKFPDELMEYAGKEVEVTGFYIPLEMNDANIVVISKYPMAECFFCGGAGPESVVVGYLEKKPSRRFKVDEIVTVKGRLQLNEDDIDELNFILKNASIYKK